MNITLEMLLGIGSIMIAMTGLAIGLLRLLYTIKADMMAELSEIAAENHRSRQEMAVKHTQLEERQTALKEKVDGILGG